MPRNSEGEMNGEEKGQTVQTARKKSRASRTNAKRNVDGQLEQASESLANFIPARICPALAPADEHGGR